MRRIVLVVPHLLSDETVPSLLKSPSTGIARLAELSRTVRLTATLPSPVPEAAFLGIAPETLDLAQGPLTVAALGYDPPERSVHFHLSLLSLDDAGIVDEPGPVPPPERMASLHEAMARLGGRSTTVLQGLGTDHALVWTDGSLDLFTAPKRDILGQPYGTLLPEGDGEPMLRRLIDDSVNLLSELPLNRERLEEGLRPLNMLWPWGQGFRPRLPNRALQRGEPARVVGTTLRLAGLARLTGETVGDASILGNGIKVDFDALFQRCMESSLTVIVLDGFTLCRRHGRLEHAEQLLAGLDGRLIQRIAEAPTEHPTRLTLLSPAGVCDDLPAPDGSSPTGLALVYDNLRKRASTIPFDERALDDARLPVFNVWEVVQEAMACDDGRS